AILDRICQLKCRLCIRAFHSRYLRAWCTQPCRRMVAGSLVVGFSQGLRKNICWLCCEDPSRRFQAVRLPVAQESNLLRQNVAPSGTRQNCDGVLAPTATGTPY